MRDNALVVGNFAQCECTVFTMYNNRVPSINRDRYMIIKYIVQHTIAASKVDWIRVLWCGKKAKNVRATGSYKSTMTIALWDIQGTSMKFHGIEKEECLYQRVVEAIGCCQHSMDGMPHRVSRKHAAAQLIHTVL